MTKLSDRSRPSSSLQIIGIHVGGVSTQKSSLVRARAYLKEICTGVSDPALHEFLCSRLAESLHGVAHAHAGKHFDAESEEQLNSPLFWEAFSSELGPASYTDSDSKLLETIGDFGGADIFCLDAPLSFPSCTQCTRPCPDVIHCPEPAVQAMMRLWQEDKESDIKRPRMPLPHTERFFEAYARRRYEHPGLSGSFDIECALSSNKAPLSARAHHLARRLRAAWPESIIVETHPWLAAVGWSLHCGYRVNHLNEFRQPESGKVARAGLLRKLELAKTAVRSAAFVEDLSLELSDHVEIFAAAMAAMSGWGLVNGLCDVQASFVQQGQLDPLLGWALVPRELATYGWGH